MPARTSQPTFVLVHGAACNAQVWGPLQRALALRGQRTLALDLPGHGMNAHHPASYYLAPQDLDAFATEPSALSGVGLADYVEYVLDNVRRVREHGPVILLGTSAGGAPISAAAEEAPELIDRLVYVSAWCCVNLPTVGGYEGWPERASNAFDAIPFAMVGDPVALGVARANLRSSDPAYLARMKLASLADATDDEFRALLDTMEPDVNYLLPNEEITLRAGRWGSVPRSYVRLTEDLSIPVALQDRMIAEADELTPDNLFDVHSVGTSHVGYFHRPAEFADLLTTLT